MMPESTTKLLQAALRDELQQLEPRFLALFDSDQERFAAPTARTQAALKTLVALTRYFPPEHSVRKAGKQLEMIWPPLIHEPRGAVAGKLLHYYFRVQQDLLGSPRAALRQALHDMAQAGIDEAVIIQGDVRIACCLQRLQQLATFLPELPARGPDTEQLSPLAQLFRWQQQLEFAAAGDEPDLTAAQQVLAPRLQVTRERCAELCAASDWSLGYFCRSGLAQDLWQLRGLTAFTGDLALSELLQELRDEFLDLHLAGTAPDARTLQSWLSKLFISAGAANGKWTSNPDPKPVSDPELSAVYERELATYRDQLQQELAGSALLPLTASIVTLLYKATWLFDAAGQKHWSRLCHCAYRVVVQYWRVKRTLPAACHALLCNMAPVLGTPVAVVTLRHWRRDLLRHWPTWTDGKRPIALRADADMATPLDAVPLLLSGSFATLVSVPSEIFGKPAAELGRQLLQELILLEKGAAAMKVWPLEQHCTLLIGIYEAHLRDGAALPSSLMEAAHRQLVLMLDQSAAWQEAPCDGDLINEMEEWLACSSGCREPYPGSGPPASKDELRLREELLTHLRTLAVVLERPVRLQLDMGGVRLDDSRMAQVLDCLRPLVKFMLLDRSVDTRGRHAMHKPRVSTLTVTLRATSATLILSVGEDSHEDALPQAEVLRLQRRLPLSAGSLVCESRAGLGRCFTLTLA